jgi:ribonuclease HI
MYPESLCARLLKAKYYPDGDLLDTAFIKNISPCWQGITHGLDLLKKVVIWCIISGEKIRIWRDNWVPRGNLKIIGNMAGSRRRWVSELINQDTRTWKEDLVRSIFHPADADHILQIKLPKVSGEDYIAWNYEKHGIFTVKSAYRLAQDLQDRNHGEGMSNRQAGERDLWKLIWKARVPPKVRVFGWKLVTNTLGVQAHRCRRKMDITPTCSICGTEAETSYHAMIICPKARALRQKMREDWDLPSDNMLRFTGHDWAIVLLSQVDTNMRARLMFLWWRTWHLRNNAIFGDGKCSIEQSSVFLQSYLLSTQDTSEIDQVTDAKGKKPLHNPTAPCSAKKNLAVTKWTKPAPGWCKLNFDAGFSAETNTGSWGAILRDEEGKTLLSAWGRTEHCPTAEVAEAMAGIQGVKAILPICHKPVHVENDCATVINALKSHVQDKSAISGLIREMKELLSFTPRFEVSRVDRTNNLVAHELAKIGRSEDERVLFESVPPCVVGLINRDCNVDLGSI